MMKQSIFSKNFKPFLVSLLISILIYFIVYYAGGTKTPYPHFCYFPIMLIALMGTWTETLLIAGLSALTMSAWLMPLNVEQSIPQTGMGWFFRAFMFLSVAALIKMSTDTKQRQQDIILENSHQMNQFSQSALHAILALAETKDPESTGKHLGKISAYAEALLNELDLPEFEKGNIINTISFHDIGKVAIPDSILMKPGKLTEVEYDIMKQHALIGGDILHRIEQSLPAGENVLRELMKTATDIVYYHHERPDGKGYPKGLTLDDIPVSARVTAICDVYDALSSVRPYKEAYPHSQCMMIILDEKGTQFDPVMVEAFARSEKTFEAILLRNKTLESQIPDVC